MKAKSMEIPKAKPDTMVILKSATVGLISFILAAARLFGSISPFSIAFVCSLPAKYLITGVVGSVIGCLLFSSPTYTMYYIIAISVIFVFKILWFKFIKAKPKPVLLCLVSFCIMSILAFSFIQFSKSVSLNAILMYLEALLAGSMTYFYAVGSNVLLRNHTSKFFSYIELSSITILLITVISALANISLFNVNIGVILGVVLIYIAMNQYGVVGASIGAIVVSIALNLYSVEMLEFCSMLIISSFLAGVFAPLKKIGQIAVFIAVSTFYMILLGAPVLLTYRLIETFFATAIYILLPQKAFHLINPNHEEKNTQNSGNSLFQNFVQTKLTFASDTIKDLQNDLITVSKKFTEIDENNICSVYDAAAGKVCKGCTRMLGCWDNNYSDTLNSFTPINDILKIEGTVSNEQMPTFFQENCCKLDKLTNAINENYYAFSIKQGKKRHIAESREMVVEQFNSIADMLLEVSEELGDIKGYDDHFSKIVSKTFTKMESKPDQVICVLDQYGHTCIEIYVQEPLKTSPKAIAEAISNVTQKDFDLPSISKIGEKIKIALFEKAAYTIDFSAQQSCCYDNPVCGDSYDYFVDSKGYAYMILSDGMGNGKRAAIDSVMTCSILLKLIKAGFGLESALKLINSSLQVKSTDESLATIDIAKIDLFTGKVEFVKAGGCPSFLYMKGDCYQISSNSLPVGIIHGIQSDKKATMMKENDIIVLVSDGVIDEGTEWLEDEIRKCSHMPAREMSIKLIHEAKRRMSAEHQDDITIMVSKLKKGV
ncbi:SpoIIE family protein phosphatase [Paludicola sp. MB14-C6]|uniref:SpoIIE family protein phosphatase n=1 Tax=Paludihabitans sp. MB14-C6 TaxID=3070656 RepID=UPI0027DC7591|nr:SpoIIE family protein phosphatase [Paludicola sp. MB14-C6]WMJ23247.1 SpoIIE family protein phosphatase [Paludicola sp. MB14-C6]